VSTLPFIIHDLQDSQMFALAQAAGRAGFPIHSLSSTNKPWIETSRYISCRTVMPSLGDVIDSVYALNLKKNHVYSGIWLPCVDDIAMFTSHFEAFLKSRHITALVASETNMDQAELDQLQRYQGSLRIPETAWLTWDNLYYQTTQLHYPIILKSARGHFQRFNSPLHLQQHLDQWEHAPKNDQRIQQYIPGETSRMATAMLLFDQQNQPVRGFTGRRLRVAQTEHGAFGETTAAKAEWIPELYRGAVELLQHLNWQGFAEVECKQGDDGRWYVLEINPRTSGWLCLAEADGAGFLQAYYALCTEQAPLKEACLQRSRSDYIRLVTAGFHTPDWLNHANPHAPRSHLLRRLIPQLYTLFRRHPNMLGGALDPLDRKASWEIFKHTLQARLFKSDRG